MIAAVVVSATAASCDESSQGTRPVYSVQNACGLEHDVFFVLLSAQKVAVLDDSSFDLNASEISDMIKSRNQAHSQLISEAFQKREEREIRFASDAEKFENGHLSESCVYIKLRLAEYLLPEE